jgi:sugar phosphate isomerase/epimerase
MNLEDCIAEVASMGAEGIEIIGEEMVPNYPNPPEAWVQHFKALLAKYHTKPACLDTFVDITWGGRRNMTKQEAVDTLVVQMKLAKRLGFDTFRPAFGGRTTNPMELVKAAIPHLEENDVRLALEIHAPAQLDSEQITGYLDLISTTKTKHFGFTPDMGIFCKRVPRVMFQNFVRHGATEKVVEYIDSAFQNGTPNDQIVAEIAKMGANDKDRECAAHASGYGPASNNPKQLAKVLPYSYNIHGKFYEMTEDLHEYSIPYDDIVPVLKASTYDRYINSEYEGQRWTQDAKETDSCEEIRRQHAMLRELLA